MKDVDRKARSIGERIWPDPGAALDRLTPARPAGAQRRRAIALTLGTAAALAAVLVSTLALRSHGAPGTGPAAALASTATAPPRQAAPVEAAPVLPAPTAPALPAAGSGSATGTVAPRPAPTHVAPALPPPTRPAPPAGTTVTLSDADAGTTVTVHAGSTVVVKLSPASVYRWTEPASSSVAVLNRTSGGATPDGGATATFNAGATGSAELAATGDPRCAPQCKTLSRLWQVTVVVVV